MTAPVFHAPTDVLQSGDIVSVDGAEAHHALSVRRLRPGESIVLTDGCGLRVGGVVQASRESLVVSVTSRVQQPPAQPRMVVVQALAKGERAQRAVELMTEVGVDVIVPWAAHHSVVSWSGERGKKAIQKWDRRAVEAATQSRRVWFPDIRQLHSSSEVAALVAGGFVVLLDEAAEVSIADITPAEDEVILVVGPEGGLTREERELFTAAGAVRRSLGPTVMRTSTAGAVAAAILLAKTARWNQTT